MIIALCPNPSVDKILQLGQFSLGSVNKCLNGKAFPGGKGVHVGLALRELGSDSKIIGFWAGPTGEWIQKECEKAGVPCSGPVVPGWTRTCITLLTKDTANNTEILETGPDATPESLHLFFDSIRAETNSVDAICVSGSWPEHSPDNVYETLQSICRLKKTDLWTDASGNRLKQALHAKPYGIHINKKEAAVIFGEDLTPLEYTDKLLDFCQVAALTDGASGLFLGYDNKIIHGICRVENIISTVGCGDCLTAGLLHAWYHNKNIDDAAATATACGAANCVRPDLGMLYKEDAERFKKNVKLKTYHR